MLPHMLAFKVSFWIGSAGEGRHKAVLFSGLKLSVSLVFYGNHIKPGPRYVSSKSFPQP